MLRATTTLRAASRCVAHARYLSSLSCSSSSTTTGTSDPLSRLNIAVVGSGRMGQIRLTGIQRDPRLRVAAIVDPLATTVRDLEQQFDTRVYDDISEAVVQCTKSGAALDGVWIATPTPTHLQTIRDALHATADSGRLKAIGIEKPVGATLEEIDEAYSVCRARNVQLVCSFQRRFDPSYEALRRACVNDRQIGQLQSIHTVFRDHPCPPIEFLQAGGDPFHDLAVHDIDFVCTLVGEWPTRVYAFGSSLSPALRDVGVMDKASVWLEFPTSGVVCTMDLSRSAQYGYDQRIEVAGELGMLQVLNPARTSVVHSGAAGVTSDVLTHSFPQRFRDAYERELDHFVDVTRGTSTPLVHWNAARMATIVSEAARIAAVEHKVVKLRLDKTRQRSAYSEPHIDVELEY